MFCALEMRIASTAARSSRPHSGTRKRIAPAWGAPPPFYISQVRPLELRVPCVPCVPCVPWSRTGFDEHVAANTCEGHLARTGLCVVHPSGHDHERDRPRVEREGHGRKRGYTFGVWSGSLAGLAVAVLGLAHAVRLSVHRQEPGCATSVTVCDCHRSARGRCGTAAWPGGGGRSRA
jgi:hypothetical protein